MLILIADTSNLNHEVQEFRRLQKRLNTLIAILDELITEDIIYSVKQELIDCALSEKVSAYP